METFEMDFIQEFIEQDDSFSDYEDCRKIRESFVSDYLSR